MASRTYYDVTQLVHWPGKLTGIPRVMHELAIRFEADKSPVVFVAWVKAINQFCEVDLKSTLSHRGQGIDYVKDGGLVGLPVTDSKQLLRRVAKKGLGAVNRISPKAHDTFVARTANARFKGSKVAKLQSGDVLVVPWGEWWDETFVVKMEQLAKQDTKIVHVLHDMTPVIIPQFAGHSTDTFPVYCRRILPLCTLVLANSQCTKKDAVKWLKDEGLVVPPIEVFRLGDDFEVAKAVPASDPLFTGSGLKGQDYILCVGTVEARKNHTILYYTYKLAASKGIELPALVVVGRKGWGSDDIFRAMSTDPEVKDRVLLLQDTSDQELSWLYDHCLFTVFPSLYEGWGIPIAESIARGVPCLCSNTSSMVEIAEGFVDHFNPASTDECLKGIQKLLEPEYLKKARQRAKGYKQFSWDESYNQVLKAMEVL